MKKTFSILIIVFAVLFSCKTIHKQETSAKDAVQQDSAADSNTVRVLKEYYSNGKIKVETAAKGNLRHGLTKNYDRDGHILSQVNYVNNTREGKATNFYPLSGKVNSTLEYKNGIKEGDEIWYYENGEQPYRVTPYIKGVANGIQKYYYEDGKLKAELPIKNGNPGTGLKEYKPDGTLITEYPILKITQKDFLKQANKIILNIELSDPSVQVKFYRGALDAGKYISDKMLVLAMQNGIAQVDFNVPQGSAMTQKVVISANLKTKFGNQLILTRNFTVNAVNNN
jgi:antitoxin component YwqK of YwqJK toxin-antitoxin module